MASKDLRRRLEENLFAGNNDEPQSDTVRSTFSQFMESLYYVVNPRLAVNAYIQFLVSVAKEYAYENVLASRTPFTFLDRLKKASHIKPLKRLADCGHLSHAKETYEKDIETELDAKEESLTFFKRAWKKSSLKALFTNPPHMSREHHAKYAANQRLEKQRVVANVLALAIVISVHLPKGNATFK